MYEGLYAKLESDGKLSFFRGQHEAGCWSVEEVTKTRANFIAFMKNVLVSGGDEQQLKSIAAELKLGWCEISPLDEPSSNV